MCDLLLSPDVIELKGVLEIRWNQKRPASCVPWKSCSEHFQEIPTKSFTTESILKAHTYAKYELCHLCFSRNFPNIFRTAILKEHLPMHAPYFIKENLPISASDEATVKNIFGGNKPSSTLTLKTKWYHSCGCCDDSQSCGQLKKCVTNKYFEKKS